MSKMRLVVLGLAAASAVGAAFMAKGLISREPEVIVAGQPVPAKQEVAMAEVLVAAKDVILGEKLGDGTLIWQQWPEANVQPSMITKATREDAINQLKDARARYAIYQGEVILEKKIVSPGDGGFMSAILPKGMRAISVAVSERTSAGGFILPNDRVDVIMTRKIAAAETTVTSETVISNVRVLAINQTFRQDAEGNGATVSEGKTATLELTLKQAEIMARLETSGELSLALRSIAEADGKSMDSQKPELAAKYTEDAKAKPKTSTVTLVRYGVQTIVKGE